MYYNNYDVRIQDLPRPKIRPGELLVRVEATGICGSDVMEWYRKDRTPLVLGHEVAGMIEEVGDGAEIYKKGERVVCAHHVPCGKCNYCLSGHETVCETLRKTNFEPGGFAEFIRLSPINAQKGVWLIPESLSFDAATFIEPVACVLRGQRQAGGVKGKFVLVIGSGISGILHIALARFFGAAYIVATDIVEYRLKQALRFGADKVFLAKAYSPELLRQLNSARRADLVVVSTGALPAISQALESVERGGTILFFAPTDKGANIPIPFNELFWRTEITLTSSYAGSPQDYKEALDLIKSGRLNVSEMITHRLSLAEAGLGFKLVTEAKESIKVIIYPQR